MESGTPPELVNDIIAAKEATLAVKAELELVRQLMDAMSTGECDGCNQVML